MNSKLARDSVYSLQVDVNVEGAALHHMKLQLFHCILDNNFIIQVKLVAASRSIFGPMFSVLHTLNFFARVIWVRHGTELQLGYLQLAMLFTAWKNEVEPIIEKHRRQESLWRVGAHYTSFPELVFITSRYDCLLVAPIP